MQIFRYKADIIPVILFLWYFLLDIWVYFSVDSISFIIAYTIVGIPLKGLICAWNHHHQHVSIFALAPLNRLLEVVYGFQTWIVWYGWVLHHNLGHHVHYQDQSLDESAWKSQKWNSYHPLIYTWIVSVTAYFRAWQVGSKYPRIRWYFLSMCAIQLTLLIGFLIYSPLSWIFIFVVPMVTWILLTVYTTYYHHSWLESSDPYESSYNITQWWYNLLTGNLGYHTAHHLKWNLHWSKLPEYHAQIESKIAEKYYKKYELLWHSRFREAI